MGEADFWYLNAVAWFACAHAFAARDFTASSIMAVCLAAGSFVAATAHVAIELSDRFGAPQ